jgi:CHAT domain-containing protein
VILPPPSALAHMVEGDGTSPAFIAAVADRLGLPPGVHRLFVSPSGILLAADLPSTFPGREVVLIPSMTAWCLLRDRADPPGKSVLALGDPAYPQTDAPAGGTRSASGLGKLPRLPATRLEARAVGSRLLLGEKATETALRAAIAAGPEGKGGRWHAIHLACHGLQDEDEPMRSALVLLADDHNDGLLTAQDVFSMSVPADLVVLSSCSAGGGRIYRGEGLVGLVGAFLAAGSPRVLVNWHEVDDESTRVLMTRFYAEWHGRTTAAEALRRAQAAVRSEKRWRDPRYWAGWRLWGLP